MRASPGGGMVGAGDAKRSACDVDCTKGRVDRERLARRLHEGRRQVQVAAAAAAEAPRPLDDLRASVEEVPPVAGQRDAARPHAAAHHAMYAAATSSIVARRIPYSTNISNAEPPFESQPV